MQSPQGSIKIQNLCIYLFGVIVACALVFFAVDQYRSSGSAPDTHLSQQSSLIAHEESPEKLYDVEQESNIPYDRVNDEVLVFDLYHPKNFDPSVRYPAVVAVHGGCYTHGSKSEMHAIAWRLAQSGFVVASVQYRLADPIQKKNLFPTGVRDVHQAIRFLRKNSDRFGIDPEKVSTYGLSAGGTIAAMAGVTLAKTRYGQEDQFSSRVHSVVTFYGRHDFTHSLKSESWDCAEKALGMKRPQDPTHPDFANFVNASVVSHVDERSARYIIFHGTEDDQVSPLHAEKLAKALRAKKIAHTRVYEEGAKHGLSKTSHELARQLLMDSVGIRRFNPQIDSRDTQEAIRSQENTREVIFRMRNEKPGLKKVQILISDDESASENQGVFLNLTLAGVPLFENVQLFDLNREEIYLLTSRPTLEIKVTPPEASSQIKTVRSFDLQLR